MAEMPLMKVKIEVNTYLTTNPPSEQGYYWLQVKDVLQIVKVVLRTIGLCIEHGQFFIPLVHYEGVGAEWSGPIPVPSRITAEVVNEK